jgi:hypothetical protein
MRLAYHPLFGLSVRSANCLRHAGLTDREKVRAMLQSRELPRPTGWAGEGTQFEMAESVGVAVRSYSLSCWVGGRSLTG